MYNQTRWLASDKMVSYCKQIGRQHSWSTLWNFSSHLVWSPCKIWLLFLIQCARMRKVPKILWRWGWKRGWPPRNMLLLICMSVPNSVILGQSMHTTATGHRGRRGGMLRDKAPNNISCILLNSRLNCSAYSQIHNASVYGEKLPP